MPRIRTIKPELPQSESLGRVSREARLAFILLFTVADDFGKLRGNSRMLASLLYPYDDDAPAQIVSWLTELEHENCIEQYSVDGNHYIRIVNWHAHQKVDRPTTSKIPDPSAQAREDSRGVSNAREGSFEDQGPRKGKEGIVDPPAHAHVREAEPEISKPPAPPRAATPPPMPAEPAGNLPSLDRLTGKAPTYPATQFHPRFKEVRDYIVGRLPGLGKQNATEVNRWLLEGADPEKDIFPTVESAIEYKRGDIGSFRYFARGVESSRKVRDEMAEQHERLTRKYAEQDKQDAERATHGEAG